MVIAVDFDGTIVSQERPYDDLTTPLEFLPEAKESLRALKRAGHVILLYSARASRALLFDPSLDPLVRANKRQVNYEKWKASRRLHWARYEQMVDFVKEHLKEEIDAIDDGMQGKPQAALFIDDRAIRYGFTVGGQGWQSIVDKYGTAEEKDNE